MNNAQKIGLVVLLALYAILPLFLKNYGIYLMTLLCVYLMAAFGLNLIVGYAGQMSIGQAAFYGIGAYIAGILMTKMGISFWLVLPIAAIACFAIGAACAGIGGVYLAALVNFIEPGQFHLSVSLMMLLAVIVGGSGRFFGPVLGSVVVILLPEWLRFLQDWYLAIFGFAVIVLMVFLPGGLLSLTDRFKFSRGAK